MDKIWNRVERWLSLRPHSQWEIEIYLKKRVKKWSQKYREGLGGASAGELYDELFKLIKESGFIDDEKFAEWWTSQRVEFRKFGSIRIESELKLKRVDTDIIKVVITKTVLPVEQALAKDWVDRIKLNQPEWSKQKILRYLASKGFPYSVISNLL